MLNVEQKQVMRLAGENSIFHARLKGSSWILCKEIMTLIEIYARLGIVILKKC